MADTIRLEKIEVCKNNGNFFFTGVLTDLKDGWIKIKTTRNEDLIFRRDQIIQRRILKEGEQ